MVNIVEKELISRRGQSKTVHATDQNDNITVNGNMTAYDRGSSNLIHLYNGSDNLWLGHKMLAYGGHNTILGDDGKKNVTIKYGMHATKSGTNEIVLSDTVQHFTTRHNLTIGGVDSHLKGQNIIVIGGNADDRIAFTSHFTVYSDAQNLVELGDGGKHVSFAHGIGAWSGGQNILDMGVGSQIVTFGGNVHAGHKGTNQILSKGGNVSIQIKHNLDAIGTNDIYIREGKAKIDVGHNMFAHGNGINRIVSGAETEVNIGHAMTSYGLNLIETGASDDVITINRGMYAYGRGTNEISTGNGHDRVNIKGHVVAGAHSINLVETGRGNDTIQLDGHIARKGLTIAADEGYDTLVLKASNVHTFKGQYQGWFADAYNTSALVGSSIEEVKVDITRGIDLNQIDWLTKMVNQHNAGFGDNVAISLALDGDGARINLGDIFTSRDESSISIIDLTGSHRNELRINDTLISNGYDGNELRVNGDSNDRVGIDGLWSAAGGFVHENENYYHIWNNAYGETLLIQDGIDIYVY